MMKLFTDKKITDSLTIIKQKYPAFLDYAIEKGVFKEQIDSINVDEKHNAIIFVTKKSQSFGTGPMKYRIEITTWYNGQTKSFDLVYRNPSDMQNEDFSWFDTTTKITDEVHEEGKTKFNLRVYNNKKTKDRDYVPVFDDAVAEPVLNAEQQETFKKLFDQEVEALCKIEFRENGHMKNHETKQEMGWEQAIVKDKAVDLKRGVGVVIIQSHIDIGIHGEDRNKQYSFSGYVIKADGTHSRIWYKTGREIQLGWLDYDENKIDKQLIDEITHTTAQKLLEKN